jgi:excisionase family DNA binding protein
MSEYLRDSEVATMLGLSRSAVIGWRRDGVGPRYLKLGRAVRYKRTDVAEWAERRARETADTLTAEVGR